jgi:hypothetical protein
MLSKTLTKGKVRNLSDCNYFEKEKTLLGGGA